jgi:chromosome segregation ATPase
MAFKLSSQELKTRETLLEELKDLGTTLETATSDYNDKVEEINKFIETIRDRLQEEFDEKSEGWQEGDKGSSVQSMISEYDTSLDSIEADVSGIDTFENLPVEPE